MIRRSEKIQGVSFHDLGRLLATGLLLGGTIFLFRNHGSAPLLAPVAARPVIVNAITPPQSKSSLSDPETGISAAELMQRWEPTILAAAKRFDIPAAWIRNVMRAESGGHTLLNGQPIISDKGAMGLMQVEPGTYVEMAAQYRLGDDPFNPHDNIYAGAAYLRWLHGKYGYPAMFAAYNAGPGQLEDLLHSGAPLPQETRFYVAGITKALGSGAEWLADVNHRSTQVIVTAPDGTKIALDRGQISGVRAAFPGEYAPGVATVISLGKTSRGVRESTDMVLASIANSKSM